MVIYNEINFISHVSNAVGILSSKSVSTIKEKR